MSSREIHKPKLSAMVTWTGINEHGKIVTDLRQLIFDSEDKLLEWIESAPVAAKPKDDGPPTRYETPIRKF